MSKYDEFESTERYFVHHPQITLRDLIEKYRKLENEKEEQNNDTKRIHSEI